MNNSEIDLQIIDSCTSNKANVQEGTNRQIKYHSSFQNLKKNATNLFNQNLYTDDQFKLQQVKSSISSNRRISICRLKDIFQPGTPLFGGQLNKKQSELQSQLPSYPRFICEMHTLPFWHYETLIQPKTVNQKGFYHVVVWKDGRLIKQTIDDTFYFDQTFKTIYNQFTNFKDFLWMHILLKAWAKCKGGYLQILQADPFDFIKTFSYPDWRIINPAAEQIQQLICNLNPIDKRDVIGIAQTKDEQNVGLFGLIPNSASYIITGHQMQFQAIFIKIKSLSGLKWNKLKSIQDSPQPQQQIKVQPNQFIMPIKQFINVFHLIYVTSNKFEAKQNIHYNRYSLNLDARESKAKMVSVEVTSPNLIQGQTDKQNKQASFMTNITIYFPSLRAYDLNRQRTEAESQQFRIPYCKLMFGRQSQTTNLQASFVQSMKQKMLQNEDADFLYGKSSIQYQWVQGTYFKGYDNSCTFLMKLKPGRYFLRFKVQTLRVQYRANINIVSSTHVKITDPKMDKKEQQQFLKEILSSKARIQKRNIGYMNPIKKGSWYICNDDFNSIGYGYIVIQTRKSSDYRIQLKVNPIALRQIGYRLKSKKDQNKYSISLEDGQGFTLIMKLQEDFQKIKQRKWPPTGIQIIRLWRKR